MHFTNISLGFSAMLGLLHFSEWDVGKLHVQVS